MSNSWKFIKKIMKDVKAGKVSEKEGDKIINGAINKMDYKKKRYNPYKNPKARKVLDEQYDEVMSDLDW